MEVDSILHQALASISPPLKMKSIEASITDTPQIIMSRIFIRHMFYKGQIILHRRFLHLPSQQGDEPDSVLYSRKACIDASLGMLHIQQTLDEETCPGGQLHTMRWRVTSIMNHQFLTATMILCGLLYHAQTLDREEEIMTALCRSRLVWMRKSENSQEAKKALETLNTVLSRARTGQQYATDDGNADQVVNERLVSKENPSVASQRTADMEPFEGLMLQDPKGFYDCKPSFPNFRSLLVKVNNSNSSTVSEPFPLTDHRQHDSIFNMNTMESITFADDWTLMND